MLVNRKVVDIEIWKIPPLGMMSDETMPPWLVSRLQAGEVYLNGVGGMSVRYLWSQRFSMPGDYVFLNEVDEIDFIKAEQFEDVFKSRDAAPAAH